MAEVFEAVTNISNRVGEGDLGKKMSGLLRPDLIAEHYEDVVRLMKLGTGRDEAFFAELELDEALEVASKVVTVNNDFLKRRLLPKFTGSRERDRDGGSWAGVVQKLIGHGHRWGELREYTLGQVRLFHGEWSWPRRAPRRT